MRRTVCEPLPSPTAVLTWSIAGVVLVVGAVALGRIMKGAPPASDLTLGTEAGKTPYFGGKSRFEATV